MTEARTLLAFDWGTDQIRAHIDELFDAFNKAGPIGGEVPVEHPDKKRLAAIERFLVVNGHSNAGKSTFAKWLAESRGANIISADVRDHDPFEREGLRSAWDALWSGRVRPLIDALALRKRPLILDWAYNPPACFDTIQLLQKTRVRCWWFDADRAAARESCVRRGQGDMSAFDAHAMAVALASEPIRELYGVRWLQVLSAGGTRPAWDSVLENIKAVDPLPWL